MSLRSACIEAMTEAIDVPGDRTDAEAALDALLGVLEEHADEFAEAIATTLWDDGRGDSVHFDHMAKALRAELLAVLREDTDV